MANEQLESSYNLATNNGYQDSSALKIRLETKELIESIELFLKGSKLEVTQDEQGHIKTQEIWMGERKANEFGVQSILNYIGSIVNTQVVQGNFPSDSPGHSDMFDNYIEEINLSLINIIFTNCYNWEIKDDDISVIIDHIMALIYPFMTRLIDNLERESYEKTITHSESHSQQGQKNGFKLFA